MNTLTLRLLINHLADIVSALEEQFDTATRKSKKLLFVRLQKSPFNEGHTYKELLPLYGIIQTLEKSLPTEPIALDENSFPATVDE